MRLPETLVLREVFVMVLSRNDPQGKVIYR